MIKSKTYNIVGNSIQASELAYTTIYVVKKDGIQQDLYGSDPNRSYIYTQSTGTITFSTEGEKAFVIYKETSPIVEPIPGVCVPVEVEDSEMPDAIVNVSYSKAFPLNGTEPYTLNVIQKPTWAIVHISLGGVVTVMGFPDVAGPETLEFSVSNCSGSAPTVLHTFDTLANADNLFIHGYSYSKIQSVSGIAYVITSGSFPVFLPKNTLRGIHNGYIGIITVVVGTILFPKVLNLSVNGVLVDSIPIPANGSYDFSSQTYLSTDIIQIILN